MQSITYVPWQGKGPELRTTRRVSASQWWEGKYFKRDTSPIRGSVFSKAADYAKHSSTWAPLIWASSTTRSRHCHGGPHCTGPAHSLTCPSLPPTARGSSSLPHHRSWHKEDSTGERWLLKWIHRWLGGQWMCESMDGMPKNSGQGKGIREGFLKGCGIWAGFWGTQTSGDEGKTHLI